MKSNLPQKGPCSWFPEFVGPLISALNEMLFGSIYILMLHRLKVFVHDVHLSISRIVKTSHLQNEALWWSLVLEFFLNLAYDNLTFSTSCAPSRGWMIFGRQDQHGVAWISHRGRDTGGRAVGDAMRRTAARCHQARWEVLREQSHAWAHHANNTKSVRWVW